MTRTETIRTFTDHLKSQRPFSFVKIGDDCVFAIRGQEGTNAEGHQYGDKISKHMKEAYEYLKDKPSVYVAEWNENPKWGDGRLPFFDALLLHEDAYLTPDLKEFYRVLRDDTRPKYYFARDRMVEAARKFKMNFIAVPYPNSYDYVEAVIGKVKEIAKPGAVILFSCGMLAKIMIYECYKICKDMTVLDMGSAFDPLFVGSTRSADEQQHERVKSYYADILQN